MHSSQCKSVCVCLCVCVTRWMRLVKPFFQEPEADQLWCLFAYIRTEPTQKTVVLLYKILLTRSLRSLESSTEQAESKLALSFCTCLLSHWHSPFFWKKGLQRELLRFGLSECFFFLFLTLCPSGLESSVLPQAYRFTTFLQTCTFPFFFLFFWFMFVGLF